MPHCKTRAYAAATLTSLLLCLGLLAGCGDDEGGGDSTTTSATTSSTTSDAGSTETGSGETTEPDGGAAPDGPSDTEQIETAVEAFLVSPDGKEVCEELVTEKLLRDAYGDLQGCLDGRGSPTLASAAKIGELEIAGGEATATAVPKGGLYDGSDVDFTVVREGQAWRIDSVKADIPVGP